MPIWDVVLFSASVLAEDPNRAEREPPLSKMSEVCPGIYLGGVRGPVADAVFDACRFRGPFVLAEKGLYGLIRYAPPGATWDDDAALAKVVFLTHLVRANEHGFEFSGRGETNDDGKVT